MANNNSALYVSQKFWPELSVSNDIALLLRQKVNTFVVLSACPQSPLGIPFEGYSRWGSIEKIENLVIYRIPVVLTLRRNYFWLFLNYFSFLILGSIALIFLNFKYRFNTTIVFASTPLTQGLLGVLSKIINPKTHLITYIQDLWPLIYEEKNLLEKVFRKSADLISKCIFHVSDLVVSQSPFFEEALVPYVKNTKLITIPNPLPDFNFFNRPRVTGVEKILEFTATDRVILFLGNIGRYQGLEQFVDIFLESKLLRLKLLILGDGSFYDRIEERIDLSASFNIMLERSVPRSLIPLIGSKSSFGLVCLKSNDAVSRTIPSKFQTYLACRLPVLSVGCRHLGDLLVNEGIGLASDWDPLSLINALQHLDVLNDQELASMSGAVVKHATAYTPEAISASFDAVFKLS